MNHAHRWIRALVESLEEETDEETRGRILEKCGRSCVPRSFIEKVKACHDESEDLDGFLENLNGVWSHVKREGDEIYVEYEECYCPLVKKYPLKNLPTFCNCSKGWIMELFGSALGRPVGVELESTIRQGGDVCRFRLIL